MAKRKVRLSRNEVVIEPRTMTGESPMENVYKSTRAKEVLEEAIAQVSTKSNEHGNTEHSFEMIAALWDAYIKHSTVAQGFMEVKPTDVAQLMVLLKIARSVYGESGDNYVDEAGYGALASLLRAASDTREG